MSACTDTRHLGSRHAKQKVGFLNLFLISQDFIRQDKARQDKAKLDAGSRSQLSTVIFCVKVQTANLLCSVCLTRFVFWFWEYLVKRKTKVVPALHNRNNYM